MFVKRLKVVLSAVVFSLFTTQASGGPLISVNRYFVQNYEQVPPGGQWSYTIVVTNGGDAPLTVSRIGTTEDVFDGYGPRGWLSVSEDQLYVLPGAENALQFDIQADLAAYEFVCNLYGEIYLKSDALNDDSLSIDLSLYLSDQDTTVFWSFVNTDTRMYSQWANPDKICVGLFASSGGAFGLPGWRGAHLDYAESGFECGERDADQVYLNSGSPFVLINDGGSVSLTVSNFQTGQVKPHYWQATTDPPELTAGTEGGYGSYMYLRTGALLNRDGRIGIERHYFAPRSPDGHSAYVIVYTKVYSGDGLPHDHVTVGSAVDWNIPSDVVGQNSSGTGSAPSRYDPLGFVYVQGTDTSGSTACQQNTHRFGTEAFILGEPWWWLRHGKEGDMPWGAFSGPQALMRDTNLSRGGMPISPAQPDGQAWWDEISNHPGFHGDIVAGNQATWLTYIHDTYLDSDDTLGIWSVLTTVRDGTLAELEAHVTAADLFYDMRIQPYCCACCLGRTGDANGSGGDEPTISDVATIIDVLFISGWDDHTIPCVDEADVNTSGGCCSNSQQVTIGDVSMLIDYLFITGPTNMELPPCNWW